MQDNPRGGGLWIAPVQNANELEAVGRLRYAVTVQEMGLEMKYADHQRQTVIEPLDASGLVLVAWEDGYVVGTLRINLLRNSHVGAYYEGYALDRFEAHLRPHLSITTRLAVLPSYRNGRAFLKLAGAAYSYAFSQGVEYDVIDCRRKLVGNFRRLGYVPHRDDFTHPEFGDVAVMALALRNLDHLLAVRSPFASLLIESQRSAAPLISMYENIQAVSGPHT